MLPAAELSAATAEDDAYPPKKSPELPENAEEKASWLSRLFFLYLSPMLALGAARPLEVSDVGKIYHGDDSATCLLEFEREWRKELLKEKPNLTHAVFRSSFKGWSQSIVAYILYATCQFIPPQALRFIIAHLEGTRILTPEWQYALVFALLVAPLLGSLALNWHNHLVSRKGIRAQAALTAAVFNKSLKLSSTSRQATSIGVIVNIMSADVIALIISSQSSITIISP
jgi:hypothetical protein